MPKIFQRGVFVTFAALFASSVVANAAAKSDWLLHRETRFGEWQVSNKQNDALAPWASQPVSADREPDRIVPLRPGLKKVRELWDDPVAPKLILIPMGEFTMGAPRSERGSFEAERPQHRVAIRNPVAVGKYDVTRGEFAEFVAETGYDPGREGCQGLSGTEFQQDTKFSWQNPGFPQTDEHPVVCVSWNDAQAYVRWLSRKTGKPYRLLSESEWEYSARGGTRTPYWWGASVDTGCVFANMADISASARFPFWGVTSCNDRNVYTSPVGSYAPNPAGLFDISGNVWQWTADCWTRDYNHAPENGASQQAGNCKVHVLRGGAWNDRPRGIRLAYRAKGRAEVRAAGIGFRVARTLAAPELTPGDLNLIARNCDPDDKMGGSFGCKQ